MEKFVKVRCVREDNQEFVMGTGSAWRIVSKGLQGIDYPSISVYSEKSAVNDGSILTGMRIEDRDIQIECKSSFTHISPQLRRQAISFFKPKIKYKIYITYQENTLWCEGVLQGLKCPAKNIHLPLQLIVKFYCPDGYLKSVDNFGKNIASISHMFAFPFICTDKIKVVSDTFNYSKNVVINNDGDEQTPPVIKITFKGECQNPQIKKDEYYVRIIDTFRNGDVLLIDCDNNRIEKNGINWIQKIDRTSSLIKMDLDVGDNTIQFGADLGDNNMEVYVYFYKHYLGM